MSKSNIHSYTAVIASITSIIAFMWVILERNTSGGVGYESITALLAITVGALMSYYLSVRLKTRNKTVFIIYSHSDKEIAAEIQNELIKKGIQAIRDEQVVKIGDRINEIIEDSIEDADKVLLLLSKSTENSEWINKEINISSKFQKVILPVMIENSNLPDAFEGIRYSEMQEITDVKITELVKSIRE